MQRGRAVSTPDFLCGVVHSDDKYRTPRQRPQADRTPYAAVRTWSVVYDDSSRSSKRSSTSMVSGGSDPSRPSSLWSSAQSHRGESYSSQSDQSEEARRHSSLISALGFEVVSPIIDESPVEGVKSFDFAETTASEAQTPTCEEEDEDASAREGRLDDGFLSAEEGDDTAWRGTRLGGQDSIFGRLSNNTSHDRIPSPSQEAQSTSVSARSSISLLPALPFSETSRRTSRGPYTPPWTAHEDSPHMRRVSEDHILPANPPDYIAANSVKQLVEQSQLLARPNSQEFTAADERRLSLRNKQWAHDGLGLSLDLFEADHTGSRSLHFTNHDLGNGSIFPVSPLSQMSGRSDDDEIQRQFSPGLVSSSPLTVSSPNTDRRSPAATVEVSPFPSPHPLPGVRSSSAIIGDSASSPPLSFTTTTESPIFVQPTSSAGSSIRAHTHAGSVPLPYVPSREDSPVAAEFDTSRRTSTEGRQIDRRPRSRQSSNSQESSGTKPSRRLSVFLSKLTQSSTSRSDNASSDPAPSLIRGIDSGQRRSNGGSLSVKTGQKFMGSTSSSRKASGSNPPRPNHVKARGSISLASPAITVTTHEASPRSPLVSSPMSTQTWRSLMSKPEYEAVSDDYGSMEMKRQEVIFELCETERSFVEALRGILEIFALPLRDRQGGWLRGVPTAAARLFDWASDIVYLHSQIADALLSARNSTPSHVVLRISDIFLPFVAQLEIHQPYLVRFEVVTRLLERMAADSTSDFGAFIRMQTLSFLNGMSLSSFLLKPVQRLMKYPLFFKQLCDLTPVDHVDYVSTTTLLYETDLVIRIMQEVKSCEDEYDELKKLSERMRGLPHDFLLARRDRRLLTRGPMKRVHVGDKHQDLLLEEYRSKQLKSSMETESLAAALPSVNLSPWSQAERALSNSSDSGSDRVSSFSTSERRSWPSTISTPDGTPASPTKFSSTKAQSRRTNVESPAFANSNQNPLFYEEGATSPPILAADTTPNHRMKPLKLKAKESMVHVFVFSDLLIIAVPIVESEAKSSSSSTKARSPIPQPNYRVLPNGGVSRITQVFDLTGRSEYDQLVALNVSSTTNSERTILFLTPETSISSSTSTNFSLPASNAYRSWLNASEKSREESGHAAGEAGSLSESQKSFFIPVTKDERTLANSPSAGYTARFESPDEYVDLATERAEREWWSVRHRKMRAKMEESRKL